MPAPKNPQTGPNPKKAPKNNKSHPDHPASPYTNAKIQTTQIVKRLNNNALGKLPKEMTSGQIQSAKLLIERTIPTLTSTTIKGSDDSPLVMKWQQ